MIQTDMSRERLQKIFTEATGAIRETDQHFSESENNLEAINGAIVPKLSESDMEKIVIQIRDEIRSLESSSSTFREQLRQATREINRLKIKMARYRNEALKDVLTRVDNRRGFEGRLAKAIERANSADAMLSLIITDIDHFKHINDTHGHLVGDNVLRMVAATIKESIKGKDLVARIGGEEFAILLPDTPFEGAMKLAESMRLTFEALDFKKKSSGESLGRITLSFGVAMYRKNEASEEFVLRADEALYLSKKNGRNKVTGQ